MPRRSLTLRREALTELTGEDLATVVGGAMSGPTCPVFDCVSAANTCDLTNQPRCFAP